MTKALVTGSAGFIGFHLSRLLLDQGYEVVGFDAMTNYYDVNLKRRRHAILLQSANFRATESRLEDHDVLRDLFERERPEVVVHLAAQAGVRYSLENPRSYLESNLVGTFNILECSREFEVGHLLMASTSSVYGANLKMPYAEVHATDHPLTFYAATKKSNEIMAHSYAHLWNLPTTMFRFFTVYGPWGRPDMALFKFVKGILEGAPIDVYNHGEMYRDFTYVDDLVRGISLLIDAVPVRPVDPATTPIWDTLSPAAPFRVVNIGNSAKVRLTDFIDAIERECGRKAIRRYHDMQKGDVPSTWADATQLRELTGYAPATDIADGIRAFVSWYKEYFGG